jgi:hypothetical protein
MYLCAVSRPGRGSRKDERVDAGNVDSLTKVGLETKKRKPETSEGVLKDLNSGCTAPDSKLEARTLKTAHTEIA